MTEPAAYRQNESSLRRVCVYCGSRPGRRPEYAAAAEQLAVALAERGIELVYGGASVGVMGRLAAAVLAAGGRATGIIPEKLVDREIAHPGLSDLLIVGSMHERKARMADLSDGFIALPGGLGTLEELFEMITWAQLGLHRKPLGVLNACGYFDGLTAFLDHAVSEGFVDQEHRAMLLVDADPGVLLEQFACYEPPYLPKWIDRESA